MEEGRVISEEEKQRLLSGDKLDADKAEEKQDDQPIEKQEEKADVKQEFNPVSFFNEKYAKNFESEDDLKTFIEKADKYDQLETSSKDIEQKLKEYREIAKGVNPLSYFANKDEYIRQQFLKNNSDKLTEEAVKELSALSPEKVGKLSELEALTKDLVVNKGLTSEEAKALISAKYDVEDFDINTLDTGQRAQIKLDVADAKSRLSDIYKGIDVPESVDWEAKRVELQESWSTPLAEAINGLDKIQLAEDIDFVVDDSMKQGLKDEIISELLVNGISPSEDALGNVIGKARDKILMRNMDKVIKSIRADIIEQEKDKLRKEVHNDKPISDDSKVTDDKPVDRDQQFKSVWG